MQEHYAFATNKYHKSLFYSKGSDYEAWQFRVLIDALEIGGLYDQKLKFLDLGAGTCRTAQLLEGLGNIEIYCVDNCIEMLGGGTLYAENIHMICNDIIDFASGASSNTFERVILKEVIHHISEVDQVLELYAQIRRILKPGGICLTLTRPQIVDHYPFFEEARIKWAQSQPDYRDYITILKDLDYASMECMQHSYRFDLAIEEWINFIRQRVWSVFSYENFTDDELEQGINKIISRQRFASQPDRVGFDDALILLKAVK